MLLHIVKRKLINGGEYMKILLKNGRLIDYKNKIDGMYDVLIEDDKISKVGKDL